MSPDMTSIRHTGSSLGHITLLCLSTLFMRVKLSQTNTSTWSVCHEDFVQTIISIDLPLSNIDFPTKCTPGPSWCALLVAKIIGKQQATWGGIMKTLTQWHALCKIKPQCWIRINHVLQVIRQQQKQIHTCLQSIKDLDFWVWRHLGMIIRHCTTLQQTILDNTLLVTRYRKFNLYSTLLIVHYLL